MASKKAIENLLAEEDSLKESLDQVEIKLNRAISPLILNQLKFYEAQGGTWPGLEVRNIAKGINVVEGYDFDEHTIRGVCLYLRGQGKLENENRDCYRLHPFRDIA